MPSYKNIIKNLIKKNISISVAESCTGGQLSKYLTDKPGISKVFNMGLITYSKKSKSFILGIPFKLIKNHGEVSEKIAYLMSTNLSKMSKSKINAREALKQIPSIDEILIPHFQHLPGPNFSVNSISAIININKLLYLVENATLL